MAEQIIKNAEDLGEIVRNYRREANLTQQTVHKHTGRSVRFIGELERGKPTAELGKTLGLLEALGIEVVLRPARPDRDNPRLLGLSGKRFWSSPVTLPVDRIIARVLAFPHIDDVGILAHRYGLGRVKAVWNTMLIREEVDPTTIRRVSRILEILSTEEGKVRFEL